MNSTPQTMEGARNVPEVEIEMRPEVDPGRPCNHTNEHLHLRESGAYRLRFQRTVPKYVTAAALDPFRQLARPLAGWLMEPHFAVHAEAPEEKPVNVPLKAPSLLVIVLAIILGPIVFVMLLPLLLVLLPAFLVIGFIGLLAAAISSESEPLRMA